MKAPALYIYRKILRYECLFKFSCLHPFSQYCKQISQHCKVVYNVVRQYAQNYKIIYIDVNFASYIQKFRWASLREKDSKNHFLMRMTLLFKI